MHGADGIQARQRAEHDVVFGGFFRNVIGFVQGVVGVGDAVGRETVADEFFLFVSAVADDIYAQLVEKFGDFRISFSIQTARVVEHFGFGRSYFCCDGAGGNDARHLAVDDVGFFLFQHLHVGEHALDVAQDAALIKINRTPLDAQGLGFFDEWAIGRGKDNLVATLPEQPS